MNLPIGVYVVSTQFENKQGLVSFEFKDNVFSAQIGVNAFTTLEEFVLIDAKKADEDFCGYKDITILIMPKGEYFIGLAPEREKKVRTFFPWPVAILGENAGVSPNEKDLRTPSMRGEESIITGTFYMGCIAVRDNMSGALILDGLSVNCKVYDERKTEKDASLIIKNCTFAARTPYCYILVSESTPESRYTEISDCRVCDISSLGGEGNILCVCSGKLLVNNLYVANTDKFLGMSDYALSRKNNVSSVCVKNSLFENSQSVNGLVFNLPEESRAKISISGCEFLNFSQSMPLNVVLPQNASLFVENTSFCGKGESAILIDGNINNVTLKGVNQTEYEQLLTKKLVNTFTKKPFVFDDKHQEIETDFTVLDELYADKKLFFGDAHCHSDSGGTSDGRTPIEQYVPEMKKLGLDFAAIMDHRQMRHFYLPCWDEKYLICANEPGTQLTEPERSDVARKMDYTMFFPDKQGLKKVVEHFKEFNFSGSELEGHFDYFETNMEFLRKLSDYIWSIGGLMGHAHPKQLMWSDNPLDYYITENTPIETVHVGANSYATKLNRKLWIELLNLGKRVKTYGSSDSHGDVSNKGLTAVYAKKHHSTDIFSCIRSGDCVAGGVGIKMCIDKAPMGSTVKYNQASILRVKIEDFHFAHKQENATYSLCIYTDKGLAFARYFTSSPQSVALKIKKRAYYRVEIVNETLGELVALSNPIWID